MVMTNSNDLIQKQEAMRLRKIQDSPEGRLMALPRFSDWLRQMQESGTVSAECRCTRPLNALRPHCPNCGSHNTYALSMMEGMLATGDKFQTMKHRCRRCGLYFTDLEMYLHCEADPPMDSIKEVRKKDKANEELKKIGFEKGIDSFREQILALRDKRLKEGE